jgi:hypothetical protein
VKWIEGIKPSEFHSQAFLLFISLEQAQLIKRKKPVAFATGFDHQVGMTGLEPATSRPPDEHSTGLSYIPNLFVLNE